MRKKSTSRWGGYLVLVIIVLAVGNLFFYFYYYSRSRSQKNFLQSQKAFFESKLRIDSPPEIKKFPDSEKKITPDAQLSIVIDDIGYAIEPLQRLLDLEAPITFAVIPHLQRSAESAGMIREAGGELILHLPMEPHRFEERFRGTQPGMLRMEMSDMELLSQLKKNLLAVPGAVGVNNHLGSKFTEDRGKMVLVLGWIKKQGLFFLDSLTSPQSVGYETAGELGVKRSRRKVFLDNDNSPSAIEIQWDRLVEITLKKRQAIAIGHLRNNTIDALTRFLPELPKKGIRLVPLSALVN